MEMEKIDARKLTPEGRKRLREMVIRLRKQSGMEVAELSAVCGVHPTTIKTWLTRARREGEGRRVNKRSASTALSDVTIHLHRVAAVMRSIAKPLF